MHLPFRHQASMNIAQQGAKKITGFYGTGQDIEDIRNDFYFHIFFTQALNYFFSFFLLSSFHGNHDQANIFLLQQFFKLVAVSQVMAGEYSCFHSTEFGCI